MELVTGLGWGLRSENTTEGLWVGNIICPGLKYGWLWLALMLSWKGPGWRYWWWLDERSGTLCVLQEWAWPPEEWSGGLALCGEQDDCCRWGGMAAGLSFLETGFMIRVDRQLPCSFSSSPSSTFLCSPASWVYLKEYLGWVQDACPFLNWILTEDTTVEGREDDRSKGRPLLLPRPPSTGLCVLSLHWMLLCWCIRQNWFCLARFNAQRTGDNGTGGASEAESSTGEDSSGVFSSAPSVGVSVSAVWVCFSSSPETGSFRVCSSCGCGSCPDMYCKGSVSESGSALSSPSTCSSSPAGLLLGRSWIGYCRTCSDLPSCSSSSLKWAVPSSLMVPPVPASSSRASGKSNAGSSNAWGVARSCEGCDVTVVSLSQLSLLSWI